MNTAITLPVGDAILGRVFNANGEPIDKKDTLENVTRVPLATPESLSKTASSPSRLLETGIKAIDLMTPLAYGSTVGFIAGYGVGKDVVTEEIMHHLFTKCQAIGVIAGMRETTYDASSLYEVVRESELEDRITMLFEQMTDDQAVRQRLLHAAMTTAAHFADNGREVLLLIDSQVISKKVMASVRQFANSRGITTLVFVPVDDQHQPQDRALLAELDAQLWFSQARAREGLWPAVDPIASNSRLLANETVPAEHQQVAGRVCATLTRYHELRERADSSSLSAESRQILARGEKINLFFTQPFFVTEAYTEIPGTYVTREQAIQSFRDLLDGRYDDTPVEKFKFVGEIEA
jgi:F-type H+-transporting ATPase subunit beta